VKQTTRTSTLGNALPEQLLVLPDISEEPSRRRQHHSAVFKAHLAHLIAADAAWIGRGIDARR
jgi:hypothetical protein